MSCERTPPCREEAAQGDPGDSAAPPLVPSPSRGNGEADSSRVSAGNRFVGQAGVTLVSEMVTHASGMLGGFILARLLTPALYGTIQAFKILYVFAPFISLGADRGMGYLLTVARGAGDEQRERSITVTGFWLYLVPHLLLLAGLACWSAWFAGGSGWLRWGYLASGISILILGLKQILTQILLSREQIRERALAQMCHGLTGLAATIPAAYFLGMAAFWLADWASAWVLLMLAAAVPRLELRAISGRIAKQIYGYGIALFVGSLVAALFNQIDRVMILGLLGTEALGYYGIGNLASKGLVVLGLAVVTPWAPRILRMLSSGELDRVRTETDQLGRAMGWFGAYLGVAGGAAIVILVDSLLPRYVAGIPVALAFVIALPAAFVQYTVPNITMFHGWYGRTIVISALLVIMAGALNLMALEWQWGVAGVALMTSTALVMQSAILLYLSWRMLGDGIGRALGRLFVFLLPLAVMLAGVPVCFLAVVALWPGSLARDVLSTMVLFFIVTSPAIFALSSELDVPGRIRLLLGRSG